MNHLATDPIQIGQNMSLFTDTIQLPRFDMICVAKKSLMHKGGLLLSKMRTTDEGAVLGDLDH